MEYRFVTENEFPWIEFSEGNTSIRMVPYDVLGIFRVQGNYRGLDPRARVEGTFFSSRGLRLLQRALEFYKANAKQIRREFNEYRSEQNKPKTTESKPLIILGAQLHDPYPG